MAGRHIRVFPWSAGRLWRRDRGGQRPRPHVREEDRLGYVEALEELLEQVRGLVNKNRTSLKYDSEALNEVLFSFLFTRMSFR